MKKELTQIEFKKLEKANKLEQIRKLYIQELYEDNTSLFRESDRAKERKLIYDITNNGKEKDILVLSDIHLPFHHKEALEEALKTPADIVVINGDFFDCYSLSVFKKEQLIQLTDEIDLGNLVLKKILNKGYDHILMLNANHEARAMKFLANKLSGHEDLYTEISKSFSMLKTLKENNRVLKTEGWWFKTGQLIFAHPDWFSRVTLRTVQNTYEDFEAICNGHTHGLGFTPFRRKILMESGCLCRGMDYLHSGQRRFVEAHVGWSVLHLDKKCHFDFNKSKQYFHSFSG